MSTEDELPFPHYERLAEDAKVALAANDPERGITQAAADAATAGDFALLSGAAGAKGPGLMQEYERALESLHLLWRQIETYDREYVGLRLGVPASWQELQNCLRSV